MFGVRGWHERHHDLRGAALHPEAPGTHVECFGPADQAERTSRPGRPRILRARPRRSGSPPGQTRGAGGDHARCRSAKRWSNVRPRHRLRAGVIVLFLAVRRGPARLERRWEDRAGPDAARSATRPRTRSTGVRSHGVRRGGPPPRELLAHSSSSPEIAPRTKSAENPSESPPREYPRPQTVHPPRLGVLPLERNPIHCGAHRSARPSRLAASHARARAGRALPHENRAPAPRHRGRAPPAPRASGSGGPRWSPGAPRAQARRARAPRHRAARLRPIPGRTAPNIESNAPPRSLFSRLRRARGDRSRRRR